MVPKMAGRTRRECKARNIKNVNEPRERVAKERSHLLAAPGSLSPTGPLFRRLWVLAFWRQQNLSRSLRR
jgi:hypothetical protein